MDEARAPHRGEHRQAADVVSKKSEMRNENGPALGTGAVARQGRSRWGRPRYVLSTREPLDRVSA